MKLNDTADRALATMQREDVEYLPVVSADGSQFLGVVRRRALERGCEPMGHRPDQCHLWNHLKTNVAQVSEDELETMDSFDCEGDGPVVTVDSRGLPVRILEEPAAR